jgi:hypothetical protein
MILTIMNCEECGADLREWDFFKKRARLIENRPYCTVCRPFIRTAYKTDGLFCTPPTNGAATLPHNRHLL